MKSLKVALFLTAFSFPLSQTVMADVNMNKLDSVESVVPHKGQIDKGVVLLGNVISKYQSNAGDIRGYIRQGSFEFGDNKLQDDEQVYEYASTFTVTLGHCDLRAMSGGKYEVMGIPISVHEYQWIPRSAIFDYSVCCSPYSLSYDPSTSTAVLEFTAPARGVRPEVRYRIRFSGAGLLNDPVVAAPSKVVVPVPKPSPSPIKK